MELIQKRSFKCIHMQLSCACRSKHYLSNKMTCMDEISMAKLETSTLSTQAYLLPRRRVK